MRWWFHVTSPAPESLEIALEVGAARHRPLVIGLDHSAISAEVDLAEAQLSMLLLAPHLDIDRRDLPAAASGLARARLAHDAADRWSLSLSIERDLSIEAGADSPRWLVEEIAFGTRPDPPAVRWNLAMARYDAEFYFRME